MSYPFYIHAATSLTASQHPCRLFFAAAAVAAPFILISNSAYAALNCTTQPTCQQLGYSKSDIDGCQNYLYCPFDKNYKACIQLESQEESGYCSSGKLDPVCQTGYAPYKIGETETKEMCLECQPATCSAYNSSYKNANEYFSGSTFYLPKVHYVSLVTSPTEKPVQSCYERCSTQVQLKPLSQCAVGDVLVYADLNGAKYYCTSYKQSLPSGCYPYQKAGVVGYKNGSKVYAVKVIGNTKFSNQDWPKKNCHTYYNNEKKSGDYAYNAGILSGRISSSFSKNGCTMSGGVASYFTNPVIGGAGGTDYWGYPDADILDKIAANFVTINDTLKAIGWTTIPQGYSCSSGLIWYDNGFTINQSGSSSGFNTIYVNVGTMIQSQFNTYCSSIRNIDSAYGVLVFQPN